MGVLKAFTPHRTRRTEPSQPLQKLGCTGNIDHCTLLSPCCSTPSNMPTCHLQPIHNCYRRAAAQYSQLSWQTILSCRNSLSVHPHTEWVTIPHQPQLPKVVAAPDEHVPAAGQRCAVCITSCQLHHRQRPQRVNQRRRVPAQRRRRKRICEQLNRWQQHKQPLLLCRVTLLVNSSFCACYNPAVSAGCEHSITTPGKLCALQLLQLQCQTGYSPVSSVRES